MYIIYLELSYFAFTFDYMLYFIPPTILFVLLPFQESYLSEKNKSMESTKRKVTLEY